MKAMLEILAENHLVSLELLKNTANYYRVSLTKRPIELLKKSYDYQIEYVSKVLDNLDDNAMKTIAENIIFVVRAVNTKRFKP